MRYLRSITFCIGLVALLISSVTGAQSDEARRAGIYVDFGNGDETWVIVPFEDASISSIELLQRSGVPILTVGFGALGEAVCMIETTGCDVSACRRTLCQEGEPDAPFWQFLEQDTSGTWVTSPLGASSSSVEDGSVNAWIWTGTMPSLPTMTIEDLVARTGFTGGNPASTSTRLDTDSSNDVNSTMIVAGSILLVTVLAGTGLVVLRKKHDATR